MTHEPFILTASLSTASRRGIDPGNISRIGRSQTLPSFFVEATAELQGKEQTLQTQPELTTEEKRRKLPGSTIFLCDTSSTRFPPSLNLFKLLRIPSQAGGTFSQAFGVLQVSQRPRRDKERGKRRSRETIFSPLYYLQTTVCPWFLSWMQPGFSALKKSSFSHSSDEEYSWRSMPPTCQKWERESIPAEVW